MEIIQELILYIDMKKVDKIAGSVVGQFIDGENYAIGRLIDEGTQGKVYKVVSV